MSHITLPTEIWDKIFKISCTDGGVTACALSLVSQRVRVQSRLYRLQSVALYGPTKLRRFLDALSTFDRHERRVRWLFLSNTVLLNGKTIEDEFEAEDACDALNLLTTLLAPWLEVLTITISSASKDMFSTLQNTSALHTFTVRGSLLFSSDGDVPYLPAVRRLHIAGDYEEDENRLVRILERWAPREHLYLSGFSSHSGIAWVLWRTLAHKTNDATPPYTPPLLHLPLLTLQPGWGSLELVARMEHDRMLEDLVDFTSLCKNGTTKVGFHPGGNDDFDEIEMRRDWEDIARGGAGAFGRAADLLSERNALDEPDARPRPRWNAHGLLIL
jgi:hypothetical protein